MPAPASQVEDDAYRIQLYCTQHPANGNWPPARSAHNLVAARDGSLLLLAGDSGVACQRFSDLWLLQNPTEQPLAWQKLTQQQQQQQQQRGDIGCVTEGSNVETSSSRTYTARSNSTAAVVGDWLLLFGGWESTGLHPLAQLEAFNLRTKTWHKSQDVSLDRTVNRSEHQNPGRTLLECSISALHPSNSCQSGPMSGPSPRGQPAAAANTAGTAVYLFGGWDGQQRYNDLWKLNVQGSNDCNAAGMHEQLPQWSWALVEPSGSSAAAPDGAVAAASVPCPRADHVMVCWHYCDDGIWKDILVVFGGSSSSGLLNDTWLFDIRTNAWSQAFHGGSPQCPRSSCAAAITGDTLLVHGGQTPAGVLDDMYLLQLCNLTWIQVDLGPLTYPLCRHSIVISHESASIFGGYTGSSSSGSNSLLQIDLQPVLQLQRSSIEDLSSRMACCGAVEKIEGLSIGQAAAGTAAAAVVKVLNKKASPAPLKLSDLPNADEVANMPQWKQVRHLHQAALVAGCDMYVDPKTGYSVFTAKYLKQRECCGNKCRHCPWGWKNVAQAGTVQW